MVTHQTIERHVAIKILMTKKGNFVSILALNSRRLKCQNFELTLVDFLIWTIISLKVGVDTLQIQCLKMH